MDHALHTLAITEDSLSDKRPCRCATRAAIFSAALSLSPILPSRPFRIISLGL